MMLLVWDGKAQSGDRPRNEGLQRKVREKWWSILGKSTENRPSEIQGAVL